MLSKKRVFVTGGAGFIGSHLVEKLLLLENEVVVFDDFSSGSKQNLAHLRDFKTLQVFAGDVRDYESLLAASRGSHAVFHMATRSVRLSLRQPTVVHDVNTTGTYNVLKAAKANQVERFLYCSSSEVNGTADLVPMPEDYHFKPETIYGASKLAGEYYTQVFHRAGWLKTVIARPHNNYGPREYYAGELGEVIPRFILWAMAGQPLLIYGDGKQTRDFTYVEETADHLIRLLSSDRCLGGTFNVCKGNEVSVRELAELIIELTGSQSTIEHLPARPSDVLRLFGDASKIQRVLGSSPKIEIRDGLARMIGWFRQNVPVTPDTLKTLTKSSWAELPAEDWCK